MYRASSKRVASLSTGTQFRRSPVTAWYRAKKGEKGEFAFLPPAYRTHVSQPKDVEWNVEKEISSFVFGVKIGEK